MQLTLIFVACFIFSTAVLQHSYVLKIAESGDPQHQRNHQGNLTKAHTKHHGSSHPSAAPMVARTLTH